MMTKTGTVGVGAPVGFVPPDETGTVGVQGVVKPREYKPVINDDKPYDPQLLMDLDCLSIIWGANNFSSKLPDKNQWIVWYKKPQENNFNGFSDCELAWTNLPRKSIRMYKYLWSGLLREGPRNEELKERIHPTQKPVGLLKNIINDTLNEENQNILDLYGGSGSTLIASEALGHNCYIMELDPYYCQIIINRWEEYTGKKAELIT